MFIFFLLKKFAKPTAENAEGVYSSSVLSARRCVKICNIRNAESLVFVQTGARDRRIFDLRAYGDRSVELLDLEVY